MAEHLTLNEKRKFNSDTKIFHLLDQLNRSQKIEPKTLLTLSSFALNPTAIPNELSLVVQCFGPSFVPPKTFELSSTPCLLNDHWMVQIHLTKEEGMARYQALCKMIDSLSQIDGVMEISGIGVSTIFLDDDDLP